MKLKIILTIILLVVAGAVGGAAQAFVYNASKPIDGVELNVLAFCLGSSASLVVATAVVAAIFQGFKIMGLTDL